MLGQKRGVGGYENGIPLQPALFVTPMREKGGGIHCKARRVDANCVGKYEQQEGGGGGTMLCYLLVGAPTKEKVENMKMIVSAIGPSF